MRKDVNRQPANCSSLSRCQLNYCYALSGHVVCPAAKFFPLPPTHLVHAHRGTHRAREYTGNVESPTRAVEPAAAAQAAQLAVEAADPGCARTIPLVLGDLGGLGSVCGPLSVGPPGHRAGLQWSASWAVCTGCQDRMVLDNKAVKIAVPRSNELSVLGPVGSRGCWKSRQVGEVAREPLAVNTRGATKKLSKTGFCGWTRVLTPVRRNPCCGA